MIAGILLAAGESKRFGEAKLLHEVNGRPLVCHTIERALRSRLRDIVVVAPPAPSALVSTITSAFPRERRLRMTVNPSPEEGMISSLKIGLRAVGDADGAMVIHGDMPFVTPEVIDALLTAFAASPGIVIPECAGERRHPRIIPKSLFAEFLDLTGHEKGLHVIDRHPEQVVLVPVGSPEDYTDIDRPADLDAFRRGGRPQAPEVEPSDG